MRGGHAPTSKKSGNDSGQQVSSAERQLTPHAQDQEDPRLHVRLGKHPAHSLTPDEMETSNILAGRGAYGEPVEPVQRNSNLRDAQHAAPPHTSQQLPLVGPSRPASAPPRPRPSPSPPPPTAAAAGFPGAMAAGAPRPDRSGTLMNHLRSFGEYIALPLRRHATPPPPGSSTPREPSRSFSGARSGSEASKAAAGAAAAAPAAAGAGGSSRLWGSVGGSRGNGGGGEGSLGRSGGAAQEPSTAGNVSGTTAMAPSVDPADGDRATAPETSVGGPGFLTSGHGGTPRSGSAGPGLQPHAQQYLADPRTGHPASLPAAQQQRQQHQQQHPKLPRAPPLPEVVRISAAAGGPRPVPQSRAASGGQPPGSLGTAAAPPAGVAGASRRQDQALHAADRAAALAAAQVLSGSRVEQHPAYQLLAALVRRQQQQQQQGGIGAAGSAGQSGSGAAAGAAAQRSAAVGAFLRALGCDAGVGE